MQCCLIVLLPCGHLSSVRHSHTGDETAKLPTPFTMIEGSLVMSAQVLSSLQKPCVSVGISGESMSVGRLPSLHCGQQMFINVNVNHGLNIKHVPMCSNTNLIPICTPVVNYVLWSTEGTSCGHCCGQSTKLYRHCRFHMHHGCSHRHQHQNYLPIKPLQHNWQMMDGDFEGK